MLKTISLFSGIGGLDFGFEAAGFETRVALELDKTSCRTIRLNRDWAVIEDDINKVSCRFIGYVHLLWIFNNFRIDGQDPLFQ